MVGAFANLDHRVERLGSDRFARTLVARQTSSPAVIMPPMINGFLADLARFGPERPHAPVSRAAARAYCSRLTRSHYENFSVASLLLPRPLLRHFHAVYAYCRWADDLADEAGGGPRALALLRWWREELLRCYEGQPRHPVMIALRETIQEFRIPPEPFLDLLFAFEQDQLVKRYRAYEQLLDYCRHSANPVGHLVLYLFRAFDAERAALADNVCTALQLANFWQDVARDYAIGRVYLPEEDRQRFGYSDADLAARRCTPAFVELMRFEVERTRDLFYRGFPLVERLPPALRPDVELFLHGGLGILRKIERCRYNAWARRPVLAKWEKGMLLLGALWRRLRSAVVRW
jgi:squalene synthase HpnC